MSEKTIAIRCYCGANVPLYWLIPEEGMSEPADDYGCVCGRIWTWNDGDPKCDDSNLERGTVVR